ncbi:unnamed protein product [Anisakis simplex]|uniref:NtCtMGAM_N domain-containing protein n=1 Tax=Anisakis simplex TaxID=6269 RepID=A0A0M3KHI8_ANISI|nr:unnamed protein product [Anisakis simplex]
MRSGMHRKCGRLAVFLSVAFVFAITMLRSSFHYYSYMLTQGGNHLLDTSFDGTAVVEIASFNTSMAKLMVVDIASKDPLNSSHIHINRRMLNGDRAEIFITELALLVPSDIAQINPYNTSSLSVDYAKLHPPVRGVVAPPFAVGSLSTDPQAKSNVLIIGLGGSQINNFLHHKFPNVGIFTRHLLLRNQLELCSNKSTFH